MSKRDQDNAESQTASQRPRMLFLCQTLPYPPNGGVKIRTYNVLRLLSQHFEIDALCFYRWKRGRMHQDVESSCSALQEFANVEVFPIPQEHDRVRLFWDHLRSIGRRRVYTYYSYQSVKYRSRLRELLATRRYDLAHIDSLDLSAYLPFLSALPVVCVHHNVESMLLQRRAAVENSNLQRRYLRHQATLMEREERRWCGRVSLNVTVSDNDSKELQALAPAGRYAVVPNGVDTTAFQPGSVEDQAGIVFVGGTTWFPNRDALHHFSDDILPVLRARGVVAPVHWVGRATEEEQKSVADSGLELTGFVPDIRPYVHRAKCYVVPLRVGGGTRLKILDAWAMGKAVVSTSVGCEGLQARDGENILIRDTPEGFAEAVQAVLDDAALRDSLGRAARTTAEQVYDWETIGDSMLEEYQTLVDPFHGSGCGIVRPEFAPDDV